MLGVKKFTKTYFCVAASLLLLLSVSSAAFGQSIDDAIKLFDAGDYTGSKQIIDNLLSADKENAMALLYSGKILAVNGDYQRAETQMKKAVKFDETFALGFYELGKLALMKPRGLLNKTHSSAQKYFRDALKADPGFSEAKFALYESYFESDKPKLAFDYISDYLKDKPNNVKGYMSMANLIKHYEYNIKKRCNQLSQIYLAAYNNNPEKAEDYFEIGWGLFLCDIINSSRLAYIRGEMKTNDIPYETYLDMMTVFYEDLKIGQARQYMELGFSKIPEEKRAILTDVEKVPPFLAFELENKYNVSPSDFVNPDYIPEHQIVYLKQLYHFATVWIDARNQIDRMKPIDYSGISAFNKPYLLFAGLRGHLDHAFSYLLGDTEKQEFLSIPFAHERTSWRMKWFRRYDATPTTPDNEMFDEFNRRVEFAYNMFWIGSNKFNKEWISQDFTGFDDRGKVYIKYGQWGDVAYDQGGQKRSSDLGDPMTTDRGYSFSANRYVQIKANQSWTYEHLDAYLSFDFVEMNQGFFTLVDHLDEAAYGQNAIRLYLNEERAEIGGFYTIANNAYRKELEAIDNYSETNDPALIRNMMQQLGRSQAEIDEEMDRLDVTGLSSLFDLPNLDPQVFLTEMLIPELAHKSETIRNYPTDIKDIVKHKRRLPISIDWATFKAEDGKTKIEIYTAVDYRNLGFLVEADEMLFSRLEYDIVLKDANINPIESDTGLTNLLVDPMDLDDENSTIRLFSYDIDPQRLLVVMNGRNLEADKEFDYEFEPILRDYSGDTLILSDIQLAYDILPAEKRNAFVKNDLSVLPYPYRIVKKSKGISIYYEIYNLTQSRDGITSYDVNYSVTVTEPNTGLINALKTLFPGRAKEVSISSRFSKMGNSPDAVESIGFDLSNLIAGRVILKVEITDKIANRVTVRTFEFEVF